MKNSGGLLKASNNIKILSYISDYPGKDLFANEISGNAGVSRMGLYLALREFENLGYLTVNKKGKSFTYKLDFDNPVIKQFKAFKNVIYLEPLVEKLKAFTDKIILYGSASRGEDTAQSDIDLAIISENLNHDEIKNEIQKFKSKKKINAELFTPFDFTQLKKKDEIYYLEIDRGAVLWEKKE